ncbi:MAG: hypothetical protein N2505_06700, partial [Endomicrobia bacterium]|nr:hypothetical protein [Endomicrobiia bacterium]
LKTQLLEAKKEIDLLREKEEMYKEYIEGYENEVKEKSNLIITLQNQISNLYKEKPSWQQKIPPSTPITQKKFTSQTPPVGLIENVFNQKQTEILDYISNLQPLQIQSEDEL